MSYLVNFTETTNPSKPSILVHDQTVETTSTSLTFVGKNYFGYAQPMAENFLHLLENFSNKSAPANPVQGQLWYDTTPGIESIKVYNSTGWVPVGGVKKEFKTPLNNAEGDLWVDTTNYQLKLYTGSAWVLVGPQYSSGAKTGPEVEVVFDIEEISRSIISLYSNNFRVAIISSVAFIPKSALPGFPSVKQGINLSTFNFNPASKEVTKLWGRSSEADALNVNGLTVNSSNFLRADAISTTDYQIRIRNDAGISIGSNLNYTISSEEFDTVFASSTPGKSIKFKLTSNEILPNAQRLLYSAVHIDTTGKIGIGVDNLNPQATLDINGNVNSIDLGLRVKGSVLVENTTNSVSISTGSIITKGGLGVEKSANFGNNIEVNGTITIGNSSLSPGIALIPGPSAGVEDALVHKIYDIGTPARSFKNVYADTFYGNIVGNVTISSGTLTGSITGSAGKLKDPTVFSMVGDVISQLISFNGEVTAQNNGEAKFNTTISPSYYTSRNSISSIDLTSDVLFVYRPTIQNLTKITTQNFLNSIPVIPVGTILPFAGTTAPDGYLFCDGSEVQRERYQTLFNIIGFTYRDQLSLRGQLTFALPDLRGRFGLGRNDMINSGLTVPDKNSTEQNQININANSGPVSRVNSNSANTLGGSFPSTLEETEQGGSDTRKLKIDNLPYHKHNLRSSDGTRYYTVNPNPISATQPPEVGGFVGKVRATGEDAQFIPVTGGIDTTLSELERPFNIMNPYLTINYIIYTGVRS